MMEILEAVDSPFLRFDFVWVPMLPSDDEEFVERGMPVNPDPRARVWWDGDLEIGQVIGDELGVSVAWDVYLLFEEGSTWEEVGPGDPDFFMHQLSGLDTDRYLDPEGFQQELEARLPDCDTLVTD